MDPITSTMLALKAGFEFGTESMKFLQTPEGQKALEQNRLNWDKFEQFMNNLFTPRR